VHRQDISIYPIGCLLIILVAEAGIPSHALPTYPTLCASYPALHTAKGGLTKLSGIAVVHSPAHTTWGARKGYSLVASQQLPGVKAAGNGCYMQIVTRASLAYLQLLSFRNKAHGTIRRAASGTSPKAGRGAWCGGF
jgi:hypothetical protein